MKFAMFFLQLFLATTALGGPAEELDSFIEKARPEWNVPGVVIMVVRDGETLLKKGYGVIDVDNEDKVDGETIFQLASVTKTFTAAALGVLVDRNRLSWDDQVIDLLPKFVLKEPYPSRYTTPRDLLAHRTGLPAFGGDLLGKLGYTNEEILSRIRYIEPASSFRNQAHYSNVGYFIAGELLGALSNSSWEQAVKTTLLEPLKMSRSGFADNLDKKNVARGHILQGGVAKVVNWDRTGGFPAAGAITSTASDMGIWMRMLLNKGFHNEKEILKPETVQEMFRSSMAGELSFSEVAPIDEYSGFDFGLGWANYHYMGKMIVEKGGGLDGIRTLVTLVPEMKLGITVLANANLTLLPEAIRAKFLELYLGESGKDLQASIKEKGEELSKLPEPPEPLPRSLPLSHSLKDFTGVFENRLYGPFDIILEGDRLIVNAGPAPFKGTLTHFSQDTFLLTWPVVNSGSNKVEFTFGPEGKAIAFQTETFGTFQPKKRS